MARSISSSISTLRSSLSDIKTAFKNVNVDVPSSLKVSQVDDYINKVDAKFPSKVVEITGEQFNSYVINACSSATNVKRILFDPYNRNIVDVDMRRYFDGSSGALYYNVSPNKDILSITFRSGNPCRIKIKDAKGMFKNFTNLKTVDLTYFDFSETTRTWDMFYNCKSLEYMNFNGHDLTNVTDMEAMFYGCSNLEYVCFDAGLKTYPKPTYLTNMFYNCTSLESVVIPFKYENVSSANRMFYNCSKLAYIAVSSDYFSWYKNSNISNATEMFYNCTSFYNYDSSKTSGANTSLYFEIIHEN